MNAVGTRFAGTPPWPLVARTGAYFGFLEPDPLPDDPTLRKPVYGRDATILDYIREWPGATASDIYRGVGLKKRDDAMRSLATLIRIGYARWEPDYHPITSLPIRRYFYIEE